jgi:hypothetical protein
MLVAIVQGKLRVVEPEMPKPSKLKVPTVNLGDGK